MNIISQNWRIGVIIIMVCRLKRLLADLYRLLEHLLSDSIIILDIILIVS